MRNSSQIFPLGLGCIQQAPSPTNHWLRPHIGYTLKYELLNLEIYTNHDDLEKKDISLKHGAKFQISMISIINFTGVTFFLLHFHLLTLGYLHRHLLDSMAYRVTSRALDMAYENERWHRGVVVLNQFLFSPLLTWEDDPIWRSYLSDGLKPPTRNLMYVDVMFLFVCGLILLVL